MAEQSRLSIVSDRTEQIDPLLLDYVRAASDSESEDQLSIILSQHAEPVIRRVMRHKLSFRLNRFDSRSEQQDAEDLQSEVVLELVSVLRELRNDQSARPIRDFQGYVAAITFRACAEYLRKKRPRRASLKNRVRYILSHLPAFDLWRSGDGEWLCGFAVWRADSTSQTSPISFVSVDGSTLPDAARETRLNPPELLAAIFDRARAPVRFDDLISVLADLWGVNDESSEAETEVLDQLPDLRTSFATEIEQRMYLRNVWEEIIQLPPRQRSALLLNLTDKKGQGVIALLPGIGIASFREIAAALEMTVDQLAAIWNNLPLEDAEVAKILGLTRQQVINLRKSARERLSRRTRAFAKSAH